MKKRSLGFLACVGFVALLYGPSQVLAQNISLGSAANFAVLGATPSVTNTGPTIVTGDVGIGPAASITGFPPGIIIGTRHLGDAVTVQAQIDLTAAYVDAQTRPCAPLPPPGGNNLTGLDLGSITGPTTLFPLGLPPGVYCFNSSAQLTGNLTLNGAGVYIFQIASTLTTASGSSVTLTNGAVACGVWWQIGASATLGTTTSFKGNVLAQASITLNTGASVDGRVLARTGTVTLDSNRVTACAGGPAPPVPPPPTPAPPTPTPTPGIPIPPVPTLEPLALALLAIALAAVAFLVLRRNL